MTDIFIGQTMSGVFKKGIICAGTVLFLLILFVISSPHAAYAGDCGVDFSASGYLFDNFEEIEYSNDGFLIIHLKLKTPFNDGRSWKGFIPTLNDECLGGVATGGIRDVALSIPSGVQFFSIRFSSLTHYDLWNDEVNSMLTCAGCSQDIPELPEYYEVFFLGSIDGGASRFQTSSHRILRDAAEPPISSSVLEISEVCEGQEFRASGYFFDNYERAEYVNGLLAYYFRLKSPHNDGRMWRSKLRLYDENCVGESFSRPPRNTSIKPYSRYYSIRFSSLTHYDIWNDETNQIEICPECSVDIVDASGYVSFHSQIDLGSIFLNSTPFPIAEEDYQAEPDPVIVIPGILGSWEKNGEFVIDPVLHTYDDLIETFKLNGFVEGETIFPFPYDWRNSNVFTAGLLRNKINEVQAICECDKVDIIAHSMGGLVARYYIQSGLYENDIDQLIFLGTPHLGSVDSYLTWEGGEISEDTSFLSFSKLLDTVLTIEARRNGFGDLFSYINDRPIISVNQLLPTFDYLRDKVTGTLRSYPTDYPRNIFLENLNSDISDLSNSGVEITNIIGNLGNGSTISVFRVVDSPELPKWEHGYPENFDDEGTDQGLEFGIGDGTVVLPSAAFIDDNLYEFSLGHRALVKGTQSFVFEVLNKKPPTEISDTSPLPNVILLFQALSPVDIQVIAPDGKRIGKNFSTGDELNEIEKAFYSGFEADNEYIAIPGPLDNEYKIIVQGTDGGGEYTIAVGYIADDVLIEREISSYILPDTQEQITFVVDNAVPENADIEDTTDLTLEILLAHIEQAYEIGWISDEDYKINLINIINAIINSTGDNQDKLLRVFLKRLDNGFKDGLINDNGFNLLREDASALIQ